MSAIDTSKIDPSISQKSFSQFDLSKLFGSDAIAAYSSADLAALERSFENIPAAIPDDSPVWLLSPNALSDRQKQLEKIKDNSAIERLPKLRDAIITSIKEQADESVLSPENAIVRVENKLFIGLLYITQIRG